MAPKPEDVMEHLLSADTETKLRAVRSIKNEIIGSQNKKLFYVKLGAVPKIVHLFATQQEKRLTIQAAATLGSFAYGNPDGVTVIVESGGLAHLLKALSSEDEKVLEASVRSLKMIFQSARSQRDVIFVHPAFNRLVSLLNYHQKPFSEDAATIIARCCRTKHHQELLVNAGALEGILTLMTSPIRNGQVEALDAVSSLSKENKSVCEALMERAEVGETLLNFTRDPDPRFRFLSSSVLTHINCALSTSSSQPLPFREQKHILQVLVKLLKEPSVYHRVAEVLANLTEEREDLQKAAYEADAAKTLCSFLEDEELLVDRPTVGILRALGTICRDLHECREQIIQLKAMDDIVACLYSKWSEVRSAAAFCIKNMTRTVRDLNYDWLHSSVRPLLHLLKDDVNDVKVMACGALCNLLMDSTCVNTVCARDGLHLLVELTQSEDPALISNAAWAFKNLSCDLPIEQRQLVLKELPWCYVKGLIYNTNHAVQESALSFLQNMCCNSSDAILQSVITWSHEELLQVINDKLIKHMEVHPDVAVTALKVASNVSTGLPEHQSAVMESGIPARLIPCLKDHRSDHVRSAAVWCVINLTWREQSQSNNSQDDAHHRAAALKELGIEAELKQMQSDESLNVRERVKTALGFFQRLDF